MSAREPRSRRRLVVALAAGLLAAGCGARDLPPPIVRDTPCAACGMGVQDLRFACERRAGNAWRVYDAIECLIRDAGSTAAGPGAAAAWLADYDRQTLHHADSMWVVRGEFASPMGGGLAAFRERAAADTIAAATRGRVDRLVALLAEAGRDARRPR